MLCPQCQQLVQAPVFSKGSAIRADISLPRTSPAEFRRHHDSLASLQQALDMGCGICKRIVKKRGGPFLQDGSVNPQIDASSFKMMYKLSIETPGNTVIGLTSSMKARQGNRDWKQTNALFFFSSQDQKPYETLWLPSEKSNGEDVLNLISRWIGNCQEHHKQCRKPKVSTPPFERILYVGNVNETSSVRLCNAGDFPVGANYLTLSHCWGNADIAVLKEARLAEYFESIALGELPQTFVDAIRITKALGFDYLWIDSMCIIQDSRRDWLTHVHAMGEIYQSSFCNICASKSLNPHGGLFATRDCTLITPFRVAIKGVPNSDSERWYDVDDLLRTEWGKQIGNCPLTQRAWVVQERALAPRCVHFAASQIFWECVELQTSESNAVAGIQQPDSRYDMMDFKAWDPFALSIPERPETVPFSAKYVMSFAKAVYGPDNVRFDLNDPDAYAARLTAMKSKFFGDQQWIKSHPLLIYWAGIVASYNKARLSRIEDRTVAVAGLARVLSKRTGSRYVAGHWLHQLPRQLLWSSFNRDSLPAFDEYIAPSWSWLSGSIGFISHNKLHPVLEANGAIDLIKIQEVELTGRDGEKNPMDELKNGRLRLRGRLIPIELDLSNWPDACHRPECTVTYWQPSSSSVPMRETFLMPVIFFLWSKKLPPATPNSLLLEATETTGVFRRIGIARLDSRYPLQWTTPYLYTSQSRAFCDEDEDQEINGSEILPDEESNEATTGGKDLTPRDELIKKQKHVATSQGETHVSLIKSLVAKAASRQQNTRLTSEKAAALRKSITGLNKFNAAYSQAVGNLGREDPVASPLEKNPKGLPPVLARELEAMRINPPKGVDRPAVYRKPNEAVGERFYVEYVEDEDSLRYGNFVIDII